jgi:hypothetical protein
MDADPAGTPHPPEESFVTITATQILLPGQAAAPDGPIDMAPMYVIHHAFRRDLRDFAVAAAATPTTDRRTWRLLADRWRFFATVLHKHHTAEDDEVWPALLDRVSAAGDERAVATLQAMEAEHAEIDPLLAACAEGFAELAGAEPVAEQHAAEGTAADARAALEIRLVAIRERLDRHLAHEERDAIELIQRYLTAADWHILDREIQRSYSARESLAVMPWVLYELPRSARDRLLTMPGAGVLLLGWRLVLRRGFERRQRRTFRYAGVG